MNPVETFRSQKGVAVFAVLRILLAFLLLWAFFDKMFGLGFSTSSANAVINGGSATYGFLEYNDGYLSGFFNSIANSAIVEFFLMAGFLLIGGALLLGIGTKISVVAGICLFFMMYLASLPLVDNPIIDDHIVYIVILLGIYVTNAGDVFGFGKQWSELDIVKKYPILK
jgi:thiosulfate dehydrogenase (quinone) large subunit